MVSDRYFDRMILSRWLRQFREEGIYLLASSSDCGFHLLLVVTRLNKRIRLAVGVTAPTAAKTYDKRNDQVFHRTSCRLTKNRSCPPEQIGGSARSINAAKVKRQTVHAFRGRCSAELAVIG